MALDTTVCRQLGRVAADHALQALTQRFGSLVAMVGCADAEDVNVGYGEALAAFVGTLVAQCQFRAAILDAADEWTALAARETELRESELLRAKAKQS